MVSSACPLPLLRSAHQVARYRPRAPIIAVTRNHQTARQAHLYRGIFPVVCKDPVQEAWAEDVDLRVNLAMNVGAWLGARARACRVGVLEHQALWDPLERGCVHLRVREPWPPSLGMFSDTSIPFSEVCAEPRGEGGPLSCGAQ